MNHPTRAILIVLLLVSAAAAEDSLKPLLDRLGGNDWADRQAAENAIVDLGPDAEPGIAAALQNATNPEVAERLQSAQARIKQNSQLFGTMLDTSRPYQNPAEAFGAIAAAAGVKLTYGSDEARRLAETPRSIRLSRPRMVLLQAFDETTNAARMQCQLLRDALIVTHYPYVPRGPSIYAGSLALRLTGSARTQTRSFTSSGRDAHQMSLNVNLFAEPKVKLTGEKIWLRIDAIEDDTGRSLVPAGLRQIELRGTGTTFSGKIPLQTLDPLPARIRKLQVALAALSMQSQRDYPIDDLTTLPQVLDYRDLKVTVSSARREDGRTRFDLQFVGPSVTGVPGKLNNRAVDERIVCPPNGMIVHDAEGKPLEVERTQSPSQRWPMVSWLVVDKDAKPSRLIWRPTDDVTQISVPFTYANVDLP